MPDDNDFKMSDLEFKKYKLRQTFEGINHDFVTGDRHAEGSSKTTSKRQADYQEYCPGARVFENIGNLCEEESEVNGGDCEDNVSSCLDSVFGESES